jgi:hypothetical protein
MEISTFRGFAFLGILLIASFLLSPGVFVASLKHRYQVWVVRRWTGRLEAGIRVCLTIFVIALFSWMVYSSARGPLESNGIRARLEMQGR